MAVVGDNIKITTTTATIVINIVIVIYFVSVISFCIPESNSNNCPDNAM